MSELRVKILLIGDSSVGKSSLLTQYVDQTFSVGNTPTIGVQYKQKSLEFTDKTSARIQIWDTAGTQRFRTITPNYYRNVDGVLIVYDITDQKSFQTIDYWLQELNSNADVANLQILIVGNKIDLEDKRIVKKQTGKEVAEKMGVDHCETSATDYPSTSKAFDGLIQKILKEKKKIEKTLVLKTEKKNKNTDCC